MPKIPDLNQFRLRTGTLLNKNHGIVLAGHKTLEEEEVAHTFAFMWRRDSDWAGRRQPWTSAITGYAPNLDNVGVTVGEDGNYHAWGNVGEHEGLVANNEIFSSANVVGRHLFTVGMSAAVYRYDSINFWKRMNLGIPANKNLEAITGFSEKEMYTVGWEGSICYIKENGAHTIDSPTNVILTDACCGDDGFVYCCGQGGIILKGRKNSWEVLQQNDTSEDFWSIECFQSRIFISSAAFLYTMGSDGLKLVKFKDDLPRSFYHLNSIDNEYLWSIGPHDLMGYDGKKWERIL